MPALALANFYAKRQLADASLALTGDYAPLTRLVSIEPHKINCVQVPFRSPRDYCLRRMRVEFDQKTQNRTPRA
jgi:hypothetical protein